MLKILIIGGTAEAAIIAKELVKRGVFVIISYAGRTVDIEPPIQSYRIGGFGGATGMSDFMKKEEITHLLDASHPFSKTITINSLVATKMANVNYICFEREKWGKEKEDSWRFVSDINKAVKLIEDDDSVFVTIGNKEIRYLNRRPKPFYLIRMITDPTDKIKLENYEIIFDKGPFELESEMNILKKYSINKLITKNSGSPAVFGKIHAARTMGVEVIMIERPALPTRKIFTDVEEVYQFFSSIA